MPFKDEILVSSEIWSFACRLSIQLCLLSWALGHHLGRVSVYMCWGMVVAQMKNSTNSLIWIIRMISGLAPGS